MNAVAKKGRKSRVLDRYLDLVQRHPLRAIRTRSDYDAAARVMDSLAVRDDLDAGESEYLDALVVLTEDFESKFVDNKPDGRTPLERLKAVLATSMTTPAQLQAILGSSHSMVSMILGGQRALSKKAIAKLAEHFRLDAAYFL